MKQLRALVKRNIKLFFKDKGMFFTSLITPMILLILYVTFLANIFKNGFSGALEAFDISERLINGCVGGQLISSILAVSCVTVAFCSNMLMVQDKVTGAINDLMITPVKPAVLAFSYYISTLISTLIICYTATAVCFGYMAFVGWYLAFGDVLLLLLDVFLLVMMGTALSSIINFFLTSQGQISAVGTIISCGYGFISGAYMPISSFGVGLQRVLLFLPGTYGTSLLRNHALNGAFTEMESIGVPSDTIILLKEAFDCNLKFFGHTVSVPIMYIILIVTVIVLVSIYILLNVFKGKKRMTSSK
ncbi:MAG: ABC transporter permease [Bacilli bacterium]